VYAALRDVSKSSRDLNAFSNVAECVGFFSTAFSQLIVARISTAAKEIFIIFFM
jgi:hypothetical protein